MCLSFRDVQRVPQGQGLKCKIGAMYKNNILDAWIHVVYFCKKSLMVIKPAFIFSIFLNSLKYIVCNSYVLLHLFYPKRLTIEEYNK